MRHVGPAGTVARADSLLGPSSGATRGRGTVLPFCRRGGGQLCAGEPHKASDDPSLAQPCRRPSAASDPSPGRSPGAKRGRGALSPGWLPPRPVPLRAPPARAAPVAGASTTPPAPAGRPPWRRSAPRWALLFAPSTPPPSAAAARAASSCLRRKAARRAARNAASSTAGGAAASAATASCLCIICVSPAHLPNLGVVLGVPPFSCGAGVVVGA